jgi:hypothetical protein
MPTYHENSVRAFVAQHSTPNTRRMLALCEAGVITWLQAYELACKSLEAGLAAVAL